MLERSPDLVVRVQTEPRGQRWHSWGTGAVSIAAAAGSWRRAGFGSGEQQGPFTAAGLRAIARPSPIPVCQLPRSSRWGADRAAWWPRPSH